MKAPFPYLGGKARIASTVWRVLGDVDHYLEPFFGSGAVLLARETWEGKTETVNDKDGIVANFWRACQFNPEEVAEWADWPVNHADFDARRALLRKTRDDPKFISSLRTDPTWCDPEVAGYWLYCASCGIASWYNSVNSIPYLSSKGMGINALSFGSVRERLLLLQKRLRKVRVTCGDWNRICAGTWQDAHWKSVGYFLDPPYGEQASRSKNCYAVDSLSVAQELETWCLLHGDKSTWRIVLCGYVGEHNSLLDAGWTAHNWATGGGWSCMHKEANENSRKETLFLSPYCLPIGADVR